jgi:hypothetical protein
VSEGTGVSALYAHEENGASVFQQLQGVNIKSTRQVLGIPGKVKSAGKESTQAFWQTTVVSQAQVGGQWTDLSYSNEGVSFDRSTGESTNCCGDFVSAGSLDDPSLTEPVTHKGLFFKFPFGVEKKTYQWWDGTLGAATGMAFIREESLEGVNTYVFRQDIGKAETGQLTVPRAVFGDSASGDVTASEMYGNVRTLWVEPNTGVIIKGQEQIDQSLQADGYPEVATTKGTIGYSLETVRQNAKDWGTKGGLLGFVNGTLTILGLVLGALLLAIGLFLLRGVRRASDARGDAGIDALIDAQARSHRST